MIGLKTRSLALDTQKFSAPMEPVGRAKHESPARDGH